MRVIVVGVLVVATLGGIAREASPQRFQPRFLLPRVCAANNFDEEAELCITNDRRQILRTDDLICSVDVHVERPTRFTIRILYDGKVQRSESELVTTRTEGAKYLRLRFPNLGFPISVTEHWNLPRGSYACDFRLGKKRVVVPFRSGGSPDTILAPHACRPLGNGTPIENVCDGAWQGRSIACTAVFARLTGHRLGVQILRGQGDGATLLYEGSDVAKVPIAAEWAYTSAPDGGFLPLGPYECRFLVDGRVVMRSPFEIKD